MSETRTNSKPTIVIFGDSNSLLSFAPNGDFGDAYPKFLGDQVEVIVDAVSGRSTLFDVESGTRGQILPGDKQSRNGFKSVVDFFEGLRKNGQKIDRFVLSLGTNDLMNPSLNQTVIDVKNNLNRLITYISLQKDIFNEQPVIILLTPFSVSEELHPEISHKIKSLEAALKNLRNVHIVTVEELKPGNDGVHFPESEHKKIATKLENELRKKLR